MQNFNQNWQFRKLNGDWQEVDLPHDAMLYETRSSSVINGVNSGFFPGGVYEYKKTFSLTKGDLCKEVSLFFEGVYQRSEVYVNGVLAGGRLYGYSEFTVDLTPYIKEGENLVLVKVDNSLEPNCRWYSGSGIYRNVWFEIREKVHPTFLRIKTISYNPAVISVETDAEAVEIYDGDRLIASGKKGEYIIDNAKLWSDETPYLYSAVAKLGAERLETTFGIRKLEWNPQKGLTVNGERIMLRGACIHQDNGVVGACSYKEAEQRRIKILKQAGYNAIRCAHNPAVRDQLDACDRIGMYVLDEAFDGWYIPKTYHDYSRVFESQWQADIRSMVEKDYNHPSVIMYSSGNEVSETSTEKGVKTCKMLTEFLHSLDDTRPVTAGINVLINVYANMGLGIYKENKNYKPEPIKTNKKYKEKKTGSAFFNLMAQKLGGLMFFMASGKKGDKALKCADALDVVGLNYAASRYDTDLKKYPQRLMLGTETMVTDLPYNWERVKNNPRILGDFVWAGWDYLGEACVGDWTYHSYKGLPLLAGSGTIDITGKITAENYYQQIIWKTRKTPFIGVRPLNHLKETATKSAWRFTDCIDSWNWQGYEGKKAVVEVYACGDYVRLQLNGKTLATKKLKKYKALFKVKYERGELTAVVMDAKGNEISRSSLKSVGGSELTIMQENNDNVVFMPIEYQNVDGEVLPLQEKEITLRTIGCKLLGLGSALCKTDHSFFDSKCVTYRGRALAVVKITGKNPKITVTDGKTTVTKEVR